MRQENEQTIENQTMAIKEFADKNGHTIIKEYQDDGWSGTILARPGLDGLRIDAKKKVWEAVIIYDPDRVARKYSYQALVIDELEEAGIKVLFVTTPPALTEEDRLLYGVKGLFAEYERARIADRFRLGKLRNAREGKVVTSAAPYGYNYIPKQGSVHGHFEINKQETIVVRMIFKWVGEEGITMMTVIKRLHEMGIPPRKGKKETWSTSTLTSLLRNETYIGLAHYNSSYAVVPQNPLKHDKYKRVKKSSRKMRPREEWIFIPVQSVIDKELFEKTQKQLKLNYELCQRNKKNDYLLAQMMYCVCGRRRTGEGPQKGKHLYYRCTDRIYHFPLPRKCKERGVNARIADDLVWSRVKKFMTSPDLIKEQAKRWVGKKKGELTNSHESIDDLKFELEKIKKEEQRYIKAYGAEMLTIEQLNETMGDLRLRRSILEKRIKDMDDSSNSMEIKLPNDEQIEEFCKQALDKLEGLSFEGKRGILTKVLTKVIGTQKELRVLGYLPIENNQNVEFKTECRNCRATECGEVYPV